MALVSISSMIFRVVRIAMTVTHPVKRAVFAQAKRLHGDSLSCCSNEYMGLVQVLMRSSSALQLPQCTGRMQDLLVLNLHPS